MVLCDFFCSTIAHNDEWLCGERGHRQACLLSGKLVRRSSLGGSHSIHARRLIRFTLAGVPAAAKKSRTHVPVTRLGMLAVLSLPVMGAWAVLSRTTPAPVTRFRELVTRGIMLVM